MPVDFTPIEESKSKVDFTPIEETKSKVDFTPISEPPKTPKPDISRYAIGATAPTWIPTATQLPKFTGEKHPIAAAIGNVPIGAAEFVLSPEGMVAAGTGGLGGLATKLVAGGFAVQGVKALETDVPEELGKAFGGQGTPMQKASALVAIPATAAQVLLGAKGVGTKAAVAEVAKSAPATAEALQATLDKSPQQPPMELTIPETPELLARPQESPVTPAIQTPEGKVVTGEDHVAAYEKAKAEVQPDTSGSKEGFVDNATGAFISREEAAAKTGLPTNVEPGKLHSSDLEQTIGPGPGAQTATEPPKPAIAQLTDAFKGLEGERVPFRTKVEKAFDIGQQLSEVKDAVGRGLAGLKAAGQYLVNKFQGYNELDNLLKAKGELSAATEQSGYLGMKWAKEVTKQFPSVEERKAITSWVDVGGDMAKLRQAEAEVPEARKAPYRKAQNLSPDAKLAAQQIQNHFEGKLQEAIDAGVLEDGIEDYIHRIYEKNPIERDKKIAYARSGALSTNPSLARQRVFQMDFEAEKAGYLPVKDFIPRILDYETSLNRAIAARKFVASVAGTPAKKATATEPAVEAVKGMTTKDGKPIVVTAGFGVPIEDASGVRQGTLIKPSSVSDEVMKNYVHRDYPALTRWKWVSTDAGGKPIMVKGDLMIHKDYVDRFDALLAPSKVRQYAAGKIALGASSAVKQTMLDLSGFHQVQVAVHGIEHRVLPHQITKEIDFNNPDVQGLLKGGMTLGGEYKFQQEGVAGRSLSRLIPGIGKALETYHEYLFRDFIPRLKTTMALDALERNRKAYAKELSSGKMSEDDLHYLTARQANAAFGELNYTMLERSKTVQDMTRILLLAPDFLEARTRFVGQALTRHGTEQRVALMLGALGLWTLARVLNKATTGDYHMEKEALLGLYHNGKTYSLRTVQGDILHLFDKPGQFIAYRLNPTTTRPAMEFLTGRDVFGRKRSGMEQLWDDVSTIIPISVRSGPERSLVESLFAAFGVNARRYKETTDILKTVAEWKKANKIGPPGEFIYDPDKDPYHKLNLALADNDDGKAVAEIKRLIDTKTKTAADMVKHFRQTAATPITGTKANDAKFLKTLNEDQKKAFEVAQQYRQQMPRLFNEALGKYYQALKNPTP